MNLQLSNSGLALLALVLANMVPLFGVVQLDWDVGSIIVLYWMENLVIGGYAVLRMLVARNIRALGYIAFFCLHYGGFCAIHGLFVLNLTGFAGDTGSIESGADWPGPLALLQMFAGLIRRIFAVAPEQFHWVVIAMIISHGVSFFLLYIGGGEYRDASTRKLMNAPYKRIVILHIAIIAGAVLVEKLGSPLGLLIALVALKTGMDIMLHRRSHATATPGVAEPQGEI